jgi:hypothetical protein
VLLAFSVSGCATAYRGPGPDLSLRGEAAEQEYLKFEMNDSFWLAPATHLGESKTIYSRESLRPMMAEVSPSSIDSLDRAHNWRTAETITLGLSLAGLIGVLATHSGSSAQTAFEIVTLSGAGISIGCGIARDVNYAESGADFNRDLRTKLGLRPTASAPNLNIALKF